MAESFNFTLPYISSNTKELSDQENPPCSLSPWKVQNIVYEILETHLLTNSPESLGYSFKQKYSKNENESTIALDISHNFKGTTPSKRPAIFVYRGDARYGAGPRVMAQRIHSNIPEAEYAQMTKVELPITVACIAGPVGFVEMFADYVKYPFLYFWKEIEEEYCLYKFRLLNVSNPEPYADAKDTFAIKIDLIAEFYDTWAIQQDALRLKTVQLGIVRNESEKPLENQ